MAAPPESLLCHLKHQLQWLQKQNYTHLNLAPLPPETHPNMSKGLQKISEIENEPLPQEEPLLHETPAASPPIHDLDALQAAYHQCQRCPLAGTRTHIVFGAGSPTAPLFFIGEGPGAEEDRQGEPFVGKAGKLLTKMVQAMGIDRPDVYIANIVKCRPPQNRTPHAEEIAQCFPIVQRQIELINPQIIVTLGNVPTRALLPHAPGITKCRGQWGHYQNWPVLPTFHPAYLLRTPAAMDLAWHDFKKIMDFCFEKKPSAEKPIPQLGSNHGSN